MAPCGGLAYGGGRRGRLGGGARLCPTQPDAQRAGDGAVQHKGGYNASEQYEGHWLPPVWVCGGYRCIVAGRGVGCNTC